MAEWDPIRKVVYATRLPTLEREASVKIEFHDHASFVSADRIGLCPPWKRAERNGTGAVGFSLTIGALQDALDQGRDMFVLELGMAFCLKAAIVVDILFQRTEKRFNLNDGLYTREDCAMIQTGHRR